MFVSAHYSDNKFNDRRLENIFILPTTSLSPILSVLLSTSIPNSSKQSLTSSHSWLMWTTLLARGRNTEDLERFEAWGNRSDFEMVNSEHRDPDKLVAVASDLLVAKFSHLRFYERIIDLKLKISISRWTSILITIGFTFLDQLL